MSTSENRTPETFRSFETFDAHEDSALTDTVSESPLAFLLRPEGHAAALDRSAGQVLEVAQVFGESVVDIRHYRRGDVVRLGLADDFAVPLDLLPEDHHPVFRHDGQGWVAQLSHGWAGFVDRGEVRTAVADRRDPDGLVRLDEGDTLVIEVGQSLFVARMVWRTRKLPVPLGKDADPVMLAVLGAMGIVAAILGVVGAYMPPPPAISSNDDLTKEFIIDLYRPKDTPPKTPVKTADPTPAAGGSAGPKESKRDPLQKRPGNPDAQVVHDKLDELFDGVDAALSETSLNADLTRGIKGLIGSKGTQLPGPGGPGSGRCLSADCTGIGIAEGEGLGDLGPRRKGGGPNDGEDWGGTKPTKQPGEIQTLEGPTFAMGGIDKPAIDRVVKQHLNQIKYCYSRELQKDPSLSGKVTVKFVIAADGSVSSAVTDKSSLGSPAAETCINGRFLRMQFPVLKGGGIAIVKYPFVFAQG